MTSPSLPAALLLLLAAPVSSAPADSAVGGIELAQLTFHQRIVIRIPRMPVGRQPFTAAPVAPITWEEHKAPKCVAAETLIAANVTDADNVDLVVRGGERLRAKLDKACRALDFYSGFYLQTQPDGMICARRDSIRSRSGDDCPIDSFKRLVPAR